MQKSCETIRGNVMKKYTQEQQVVEAIRSQGGYTTLKRLNEIIDFSSWKSKTPEASVRRIVQDSHAIFRIQPGLWALEECKDAVIRRFNIVGDKRSQEKFSHAFYQGLIVEIGKMQHKTTYIPPQDKHRLFLDKELGEVSDMVELPHFTYESLMRRAKTIDVIWFNERNMPSHFYEVEHTTDIRNSLSKFYELQDFFSKFYIVAGEYRKAEYEDKISSSIYSPIRRRVTFLDYEQVASVHSSISQQTKFQW